MKYNKPTIDVLGEAVRVIQGGKGVFSTDGSPTPPNQINNPVPPTYELDE